MSVHGRSGALGVVATALLLVTTAGCGENGDAGADSLTLGATSASSSAFGFVSTHMRLATKKDPSLAVVVRETGGGAENLDLVLNGTIDIGLASADYTAKEIGEGKPIRNLMNATEAANVILVDATAGIDSIEDLEGKPFAPGADGSSATDTMDSLIRSLGVDYERFVGDSEDIVNAMQDGRIVGFAKATVGLTQLDATQINAMSTVDLEPVGFSDEQIAQLTKKVPSVQYVEVSNLYSDQGPPFKSMHVAFNYFVSTDMSDDLAYRLTAAFQDSLAEASKAANFPGAKGVGPDATVATAGTAKLHPGAERYYREKGLL